LRTTQLTVDRAAKMSLAPLNTLVLGTRRRSSMGSPKIFNLPKMTFIQVSLATGNGMARKVLICDNLISPDRGAFSHPFVMAPHQPFAQATRRSLRG
jgi:hypothetical protein